MCCAVHLQARLHTQGERSYTGTFTAERLSSFLASRASAATDPPRPKVRRFGASAASRSTLAGSGTRLGLWFMMKWTRLGAAPSEGSWANSLWFRSSHRRPGQGREVAQGAGRSHREGRG